MGSTQTATFGDGCFWYVEAALKELDNISEVISGYVDDETENPNYEQVCPGNIGHAEVVQVDYDPTVVGYDELLDVLFAVRDPTQLNRQGPDVGTQYCSITLSHGDEQKRQASVYVDALNEKYDDEVATELVLLEIFYGVEEYHQDYSEKVNTADGSTSDVYCRFNIVPKIEKARKKFANKVEAEAKPNA